MQKKFISNLLLLILLNLLIKPLAIFGIDAGVQNRVGTADYGLYFSLLNLSYIFNILLDFGINNFTTKNVAKFPSIVPAYMGKLIALKIVLFLVYALVTFITAWSIGISEIGYSILIILILNQFLIVSIAYLRSHFTGLMLFKSEALISVLDKVLLIFICGYFLYGSLRESFTITDFVSIQLTCYLLTFVFAFLLLIRKIGLPKLRWKPVFTYAVLRQSFPYALLVLLMTFYSRTDSIMIERLLVDGSLQSGYYAQGFRLLDAAFVFAMLFSALLFPIFSRMIQQKADVSGIIRSATGILLSGAFVISVITFFHAELILSWIYDDMHLIAIDSFRLLMFSFIGMCSVLIYGTLLTAKGDLKLLNLISLGGIILNICLNLILIPKTGAVGAAFATFVTQSLIAIVQYLLARKKMSLYFSGSFFLRFIVFLICITGLSWTLSAYSASEVLNLTLELAVGLVLIVLLRIVDLRQLKREMFGDKVISNSIEE